jgi:Mrr N-terminal domain
VTGISTEVTGASGWLRRVDRVGAVWAGRRSERPGADATRPDLNAASFPFVGLVTILDSAKLARLPALATSRLAERSDDGVEKVVGSDSTLCTLRVVATRKRQRELVRGVLGVLAEHPEGVVAAEVLKAVEQRVPPTPHEQPDYPNHPGVRRFEKTVHCATIGPVKAGWLVKDKGEWSITDEGRAAYASFTEPEALQHEWAKLYKAWKKSRPEPTADGDEADEQIRDDAGGGTRTRMTEVTRF